ncbi:MAG: hypothetical protein ACI4WT_10800 [Oligosphaeraceae bacterium]
MTEQNRFVAADWLPTGNGPVITCYGNCVEIGLGLTLNDVRRLFAGMRDADEDLGVRVWLESDDGTLRVFLRVVAGRGLRVLDDLKAECLWRLAISEVFVALAWNAMADQSYAEVVRDEVTQGFASSENLRIFNLLETIGGPL